MACLEPAAGLIFNCDRGRRQYCSEDFQDTLAASYSTVFSGSSRSALRSRTTAVSLNRLPGSISFDCKDRFLSAPARTHGAGAQAGGCL